MDIPPASSVQSPHPKWRSADLFVPIDGASIALFRIGFGLFMLWEVMRYFQEDWIATYWIKPKIHFGYWPFDFLQPLPGNGMYWLFGLMGVLAIGIAAGCLYRVCAALFWVGFTYTFLLEQTRYLNHFYLISLLSFILIFIPAHRTFSVDMLLFRRMMDAQMPLWGLWWLRFTITLPYFFGGIAKLNSDWLQGEPLRMWVMGKTDLNWIARLLAHPDILLGMSWGGMMLDLLVVPALLWRRTRLAAFLAVALFHFLNAQLFNIGVFPGLMLAATTLFFEPDWPLRLWRRLRRGAGGEDPHSSPLRPVIGMQQRLLLLLIASFCAVQLFLPIRHFFIPSRVDWTEEGHRYAWHMKLRDKKAYGFFVVRAEGASAGTTIQSSAYLEPWQDEIMLTKPCLIWQFAQFLKAEAAAHGQAVHVYADIHCSLNGRKYLQFTDPTVDLTAVPRPWWPPTAWIMPMTEALQPGGD